MRRRRRPCSSVRAAPSEMCGARFVCDDPYRRSARPLDDDLAPPLFLLGRPRADPFQCNPLSFSPPPPPPNAGNGCRMDATELVAPLVVRASRRMGGPCFAGAKPERWRGTRAELVDWRPRTRVTRALGMHM